MQGADEPDRDADGSLGTNLSRWREDRVTVGQLIAALSGCDPDYEVACFNWEVLGGQRHSADVYTVEAVEEATASVSLVITYCDEV